MEYENPEKMALCISLLLHCCHDKILNKSFLFFLQVINMEDENPEKMTLLRKYSAIYGRFDSKRKNEFKMSMHEVNIQPYEDLLS